jgi:hypothetical protein
LRPVHRAGDVVDFAFEQVNPAAGNLGTDGRRLVGTTLLTVLPSVGARQVLPLLRAVLSDGLPRQVDDLRITGRRPHQVDAYLAVRAARLGDRVLVAWQWRSPAEAMYDDMLAAGHAARVAAYRWDLATGELRGSPNLRIVLGWQSGLPPTATTVGQAFHPVHWRSLRRAIVATVRTGARLDLNLPAARGQRWLRVVGERLVDGGRHPIAISGSIQDLTYLSSLRSRLPQNRTGRRIDREPAHRTRVSGLGSVGSG